MPKIFCLHKKRHPLVYIQTSLLIGGYLAALWYMLDKSIKGFTWESFTDYLNNLLSSTITTLDAAALVSPILLSIYIGLGLIWSAASMGSAIIAIEEHIKVNLPLTAERLTFWEFFNVATGPLL